jgi:hypothetical protein
MLRKRMVLFSRFRYIYDILRVKLQR